MISEPVLLTLAQAEIEFLNGRLFLLILLVREYAAAIRLTESIEVPEATCDCLVYARFPCH